MQARERERERSDSPPCPGERERERERERGLGRRGAGMRPGLFLCLVLREGLSAGEWEQTAPVVPMLGDPNANRSLIQKERERERERDTERERKLWSMSSAVLFSGPAYSPSHPPDKARGWGYRPAKRCRCANRRAGKGPERRPDPSPRRERERERQTGRGGEGRSTRSGRAVGSGTAPFAFPVL